MSEVVEKFGRVIVIEDDIVLSNAALQYFNSALEYYKNHQDVFSISAFNFQNFSVPPTYKYDTYFIPRMQCWGWATWKEKWAFADFQMKDFDNFISDDIEVANYKRLIGANSLSTLTACVQDGKDVWACRWVYAHFKHRSFCVCPVISYVDNIGLDGTGQNCGNQKIDARSDLNSKSVLNFAPKGEVNEDIFRNFMVNAVPGSQADQHRYGRLEKFNKADEVETIFKRVSQKIKKFIG